MALDFSTLTAADAELPAITRGDTGPNPFVDMLRDSQTRKVGKMVTVPLAEEPKATYLIRQAAKTLDVGARIVYQTAVGAKLDVARDPKAPKGTSGRFLARNDSGKEYKGESVKILFSVKPKKVYKAKETPANGQTAIA